MCCKVRYIFYCDLYVSIVTLANVKWTFSNCQETFASYIYIYMLKVAFLNGLESGMRRCTRQMAGEIKANFIAVARNALVPKVGTCWSSKLGCAVVKAGRLLYTWSAMISVRDILRREGEWHDSTVIYLYLFLCMRRAMHRFSKRNCQKHHRWSDRRHERLTHLRSAPYCTLLSIHLHRHRIWHLCS